MKWQPPNNSCGDQKINTRVIQKIKKTFAITFFLDVILHEDFVHIFGQQILSIFNIFFNLTRYMYFRKLLAICRREMSYGARFDCAVFDIHSVED